MKSISRLGLSIILLLAVQYALGFYVNLFVTFPEGAQDGAAWMFAWTQLSLGAHIILGVLLALAVLIFLVQAARSGSKTILDLSIVGLVSVLLSGASGAVFIATQSDPLSLVMSLLFLVAVGSYIYAVVLASQKSSGR